MSTVLIVVALVAVLAIVAAAVFVLGPGRGGGRRGLKRRFGPEYEQTLARHDGDTKAAERELNERVKRHGGLKPKPLANETREQYVALWAGLQERFVDSPDQSVAAADQLLGKLAGERGFPEATEYEDQLAALSVHHPERVGGYRRLHRAARGEASTEELREAMVDARALFTVLVTAHPVDTRSRPARPAGHGGRRHQLNPKGSGA
ncbi:hypothetical protein OG883_14920 [Streptomyces sp. NBC_01142]|uniref:hypothetical protein n=1 Tax=Streptomyces sp. NBC_01142 TaxID=2975865 RepID=UPI002259F142|nr:hypothetical protein [Streptomyces sp. NBC_01142]MCX4821180.1 hypothetical protein [Streptomyces sp. NBC_01142]